MLNSLNYAQVVCFTSNYSFRGAISTGKRRLSDTLNDRISDYVELVDVQVYNVHRPDTRVHAAPEIFLRKTSLALVAILAEVGTEAAKGRFYGFVSKARHEAVIFLPNYEVRGLLHLSGKYEVHGPLAVEGESFIAVTNAQATATLNPRLRLKADTILVRQNLIEGFYISPKEQEKS
jgi:hypothetical protein